MSLLPVLCGYRSTRMLLFNCHIILYRSPVVLKARPGQNPSAYDYTRSHSREHITTTAAEFNHFRLLEKSK
jgi:hypothetical protein